MPTVREEIDRLARKIKAGELDPDTPAWTLVGHDPNAPAAIVCWITVSKVLGVPNKKLARAWSAVEDMRKWPVKRIPGTKQTLKASRVK